MAGRAWTVSVLILIVLLAAAGPVPAAEGLVEGYIALTLPDGETVHGDWIRVMLVTDAVDVEAIRSAVSAQAAAVPGARHGVLANRLQLDFYKAVSTRRDREEVYLHATTLTTEDGTFKFTGVPAGRYWVVVTFPSVIRGCKVAWQEPVLVAAGETARVTLTEANLLFPPDRSR